MIIQIPLGPPGGFDPLTCSNNLVTTANLISVLQVVEMSSEGKRLLKRLFESFDENEDGLLSELEMFEMFSTAPVRSVPQDSYTQASYIITRAVRSSPHKCRVSP